MIGDADVAVALLPAGEGQLLHRVGAVAVVGVAVQEPGEVGALEQARQRASCRQRDLVAALAQFRRHELQAERAVQRRLIGRRHELAAAPERGTAQRIAHGRGVGREQAEVRIAARGLDQHRAKVDRRRDDDLRGGATGEAQRDAPLVLAGKLAHARKLAQLRKQLRRRCVAREHDDHVAHHLGAAAHVARDDGLAHALELAQRRAQHLRLLARRDATGARRSPAAGSGSP